LCSLKGCRPQEFSRIISEGISIDHFEIIYRSLTRPINIINIKDILNKSWSPGDLDNLEKMFRRVGINLKRHYIDAIVGCYINRDTLLEMINRIPSRYYDAKKVETALQLQENKYYLEGIYS
jgi:hypothetical protein